MIRMTWKRPLIMAKMKARRRSSRDPLQIQISAHVDVPRGRSIDANVIAEAIAYRLDEGENPEGITLRIVQWRNPTRKTAALQAWRSGDQDAAWATLGNAIRGWLAGSATVDVRTIRRRQGNRRTK